MSSRFLDACRLRPTDCTPIWLMRQAGRYQASYQALRQQHSFLEMCRTPELAARITCAAVDELGVDAAIIFSDILLVLEAMGAPVEFTEAGPVLHDPLRDRQAVDRLKVPDPQQALPYVMEAIQQTRGSLREEVPLIGFAGAPLTLASYLVEGGGSKSYLNLRRLLFGDPHTAHALLEKLTRAVTGLLRAQVEAGCQAIQLFDSWGGTLGPQDYARFGLPYLRRIMEGVGGGVPKIIFGTGTATLLDQLGQSGADVVGLDWRVDLAQARRRLGPKMAIQGNLDPGCLFLGRQELEQRVAELLQQAGGAPGYIFNLGHGVLQTTDEDKVRFLVETVHRLSGASRAPRPAWGGPAAELHQVDADKLVRLSRPGPRYTSYPTAPEWTDRVGPADLAQYLEKADKAGPDQALSLYFHIPFCRHMCSYCACNVVLARRQERADLYIDYLARELSLVCKYLRRRRSVIQLHLGGGTPTFLSEPQLLRLHKEITSRFDMLPGAEIALEIDPVVTTEEQLALLRGCGFNRVSMGIQDFTPEVQQTVGRVQSVGHTRRLYNFARELGYSGINFDLIFGLPEQREETFAATVDQVLEMAPDRVAVFGYAHVPWMRPNQRKFDEASIPSPVGRFRLFTIALRAFTEAGYVQIGMDHFARPDDELARARRGRRLHRNFQGYTVLPASDILAFGITGISEVQGLYAQNLKPLGRYYRTLEQDRLATERGWVMTAEDRLRREVIHQIMCNFHVDLEQACQPNDRDPRSLFKGELERLRECEEAGLVSRRDLVLELTPLGRVLVRNVAMVFDAYLQKNKRSGPTFSKTL